MGVLRKDVDMYPSDLQFSIFTGEEIKRLSVVKVITGLAFDPLGHPLPRGLYDNAMGSYGRSMDPCGTCLSIGQCPGHMGHIELNALVYNPFFIKFIHDILKLFCLGCYKIQMNATTLEILLLQLQLVDAGYVIEAQELEIYKSNVVYHNTEQLVKTESGGNSHPKVAAMRELLEKGETNLYNNTKTSCAVRAALVHNALQSTTSKKCMHCNNTLNRVKYMYRKLTMYIKKSESRKSSQGDALNTGQNKVILADECRNFLREIWKKYETFLQVLFPILKTSSDDVEYAVDLLFMNVIPVTPPKSRPTNVLQNQIVEHPQTTMYRNIVEMNSVLRAIMVSMKSDNPEINKDIQIVYEAARGSTALEKMYFAWQALQTAVDILLDATVTRESSSSQGLKQVLEKKEGLIRKHMMGKRVNYAARTVITPDPNINVEEVGLPDIFAKKLSYPVSVTPWNVSELRKMVMNGPHIHPGANYIEDERGYTTIIPGDNPAKRESMAKLLLNGPETGLKIVHRHVLNGDVLLLNRQPSLHKPSIMAHKARILRGEKTFRLHYSNCKAYNADFDGDEMNAHLPQNEVSRSEAYNLANVANNYLVPKDGTPLGGLIQDHVISGVKLSIRGRFFNREDYQQLVFQGLSHVRGTIRLLPPTIIKPIALWSGKQIISTVIINLIPKGYSAINLSSTAKIGNKHWNVAEQRTQVAGGTHLSDLQMSESEVIIRQGELVVGVLDKEQYGATPYGLIHCMYELYGGDVSTRLLTSFTKIFNNFLQRQGFTLGVKDILVTGAADAKRKEIIKDSREIGDMAVAAALELNTVPPLDILAAKVEEAYIKDPKFRVVLDRKYKTMLDRYTNDINKTCLPEGLITQFPENNLQLMVLSGAKGSMVNTMQISCLLGQIELEGKRPPLMISGKSLPSFTSFETSPKSGGFIDGRFMTGIQPQDFFFHCMAGREGLIDTAVKTSRSGYLQRCLIKHLEGLSVNYDLTVRDSDNTVVQFLYGEDGMDILKAKFFNTKCAKFLDENSSVILRRSQLNSIKDEETLSRTQKHTKKLKSWQKKNSQLPTKRTLSSFTRFSSELRDEVEVEKPNLRNKRTGRQKIDEALVKLWNKADEDAKKKYQKKFGRCPDTTMSKYRPDNFYGSVSEYVEKLISSYAEANPHRKETISDIMYIKNLKSLAAPGEPVGLLAAQSIGEPSTQMTLNTFHFAGRGEMNVTLGIPRLREILMLASVNIKTPSMDIPVKPNQIKNADKLRVKLNRVTLADILEYVNVKIRLMQMHNRGYEYKIRFQFLPREAYQDDFCVRPNKVLKYMSGTFFKQLFRSIIKSAKTKSVLIDMEDGEGQKKKGAENNSDELINDDYEAPEDSNARNGKTNGDDDGNSSDGDNYADGDDATGIKLKTRTQDETEYDDPEVAEEIDDANDKEVEEDYVENLNEIPEQTEDPNEDDEISKVMDNEMVSNYIYDREHHLWCELTFNLEMSYRNQDISNIIRELAEKSVIHQVNKIKRAITYKSGNDLMLKTDGINIVEMFKHNKVLDLNRIYSNDIHGIANTYGIEAAVKVIVKEVQNVFKVYGITVDPRHLLLIADYMTFEGTFRPLSRKGMEFSSSPLQQMSFESCMQFLRSATISGRGDELNSPSSRLMVGLPVKNGTGCFDLRCKMV